MGFLKQLVSDPGKAIQDTVGKVTGATQQADAMRDAASQQAAATRAAAEQAAAATNESAKQSAAQIAATAQRAAAASASAEALSKAPENPDVQIGTPASGSAVKKRRQQFGIGSAGTGVNI
jgi:hypothetical protein